MPRLRLVREANRLDERPEQQIDADAGDVVLVIVKESPNFTAFATGVASLSRMSEMLLGVRFEIEKFEETKSA
jgi:hypothetical protein